MTKKYEFTGETKMHFGIELKRIRALVAFGSVAVGELGGWIASEAILSHDGNAWVSGNAWVYGNARVSGNAWVVGDALVSGNAWVSGNARVVGNARVFDNARVSGNALVSDNAWVVGNALVSGNARVSGNALVSGNAWVSGNACVYGNARVFDNARVSGNARVVGDAWVSPINITGLTYNVTITDHHIKIGCEFHSIEAWSAFNNDEIAKMDGTASARFWREHKDLILGIAKANGRPIEAEPKSEVVS